MDNPLQDDSRRVTVSRDCSCSESGALVRVGNLANQKVCTLSVLLTAPRIPSMISLLLRGPSPRP